MQQITNTHAAKGKNPVLSLAISWLIILGTYFLLRLIFIVFGFHLYAGLLGGCLAFVPYLISTIYLYKSTRTTNIWIYILGIALPNIIEKIVLYLMGAFLYGVDPANVSSALQRIASNEPYTNFFTHPSGLIQSSRPVYTPNAAVEQFAKFHARVACHQRRSLLRNI